MAFAAVVSLVEVTNRNEVSTCAAAATSFQRVQRVGKRRRKISRTSAEKMQRPVRMETGCQSVALIMNPPVLHSTAARTRNRIARGRWDISSISGFSDPRWIENGDEARRSAIRGRHLGVQLYPVELPMLRVGVNAHNGPIEPTLALPEI